MAKLKNIMSALVNQPLLVLPERLEEITSYLELRLQGDNPDPKEIASDFVSSVPSFEAGANDDPMVDGVRVVNVSGTLTPRANWMNSYSSMTSTQHFASKMIEAGNDDDVKRIVVHFDTPGGQAQGVAEAAQITRRISKVKPVTAAGRVVVASGGFWLAASCPTFVAEPSCMVGGFGVFIITKEMVEAAEKVGVKFHIFSAGDVKVAGSPYKVMSSAERKYLNERVDAIYQSFGSALAEYRGVSLETVIEEFGQGAVFQAEEAAERNMVDEVMLFEEVVDRERRAARGQVISTVSYSANSQLENDMKVTQKVRAALFATGLIPSMEASEETCVTVINALYAGRGETVPEEEAKIIDAINGKTVTQSPVVVGTPFATGDGATADPIAATDAQIALKVNQALAEQSHRINILNEKGRLFGISAEEINTVISDSSVSVDQATVKWAEQVSTREPQVAGSHLSFGPAEADKFVEGATEALVARTLGSQYADQEILRGVGASVKNMRAIDIARVELAKTNYQSRGDDEDDALAWLQSMGSEIITMAADGGADGVGAHPDVLSNLQGKILEKELPTAPIHYSEWMERLPDLTDFKPKSILDTGIWAELDVLDDTESFREKTYDTELAAWIQAEQYGNKAALTVRMIANDDMGSFARQLNSFPGASRLTLQHLALDLVVGNYDLVDGNAQYSTGAGNQVASGAAPSATSASEHRELHLLQKNKGTEGANVPINVPPSIVLCPVNLIDAAKQTYEFLEGKTPATDANKSTVVGTMERIIFDAYLDGYSSVKWWTFINPAIYGAFGYSFYKGYGENGKRTMWWDPDKRVRYVAYESRFAVCPKSRRGVVYNPGT